MASQCVPLAVCGSVFTIRVAVRVIEGGRMYDGKEPRNEGTSFNMQSIWAVTIIKSLWKQCAADLYAHSYHIRDTADT